MSSPHDARVLVAVSAHVSESVGSDVADDIEASLDATVIRKQGAVATEFLRELGPTIDCVVCVSHRTTCIENLTEAAGEIPLVVYGDEVPSVPVDEVVATDGGTRVLARRVADRIERERERNSLSEANAKLSALNAYTRELTGCETVDEVSDTVVEAVTNALGHGRVVLAMCDGDVFYPYGHTLPTEPDRNLPVENGIAGRTYRTGETQIVDEYGTDPDHYHDVESITSVLSVPMGDHGVIQVSSNLASTFDEDDAEFLEIVAAHAREALSRLKREMDLRLERDRLHGFFDGLRAPVVYLESVDGEEPVLKEINTAYETVFGDEDVGVPVSQAFSTETERELFGDLPRSTDVVHREFVRETSNGEQSVTLEVVPVKTAGLHAAAFGLYTGDIELS